MQDDIYVGPPTFSLAPQCPPFFNSRIATAVQYCVLTRAAVKLLLFKENDLSYSIQPVITIKITDTA